MANFEKAITAVLAHEGGYVNDQKDPGGETKFGITKRSYPDLDIKSLTKEQAIEIYRKDWWDAGAYNGIANDDLATKVFDTAVNVGSKRAYKFLQQAVVSIGGKLVIDGNLGPKTLEVVNKLDPTKLLSVYRTIQTNYYKSLASTKPTLTKFLRGWLARAES